MIAMAQPSTNGNDLEAEIERVRMLRIDQLRTMWRSTFGSTAPTALTKDLLARSLIWRLQERSMGGLDPATVKVLNSVRRGEGSPDEGKRRLKPGTVLVREYQGERHTVTVVPGGFVWRETTYGSLPPSPGSSRAPPGTDPGSSACGLPAGRWAMARDRQSNPANVGR